MKKFEIFTSISENLLKNFKKYRHTDILILINIIMKIFKQSKAKETV